MHCIPLQLDQLPPADSRQVRLAVLGDPIHHSLSPAMHSAALANLARSDCAFANWTYVPIVTPAARVREALLHLHTAGFHGMNLTIPHKVDAMDCIECADEQALKMGAVNTLIRTPTGYRGTNTDGYGILQAIQQAFGCSLQDREVWLLGAGGAARGILVAVLGAGARRVHVVNRSAERLASMRALTLSWPAQEQGAIQWLQPENLPAQLPAGTILINATALGLKAEDPLPIPAQCLHEKLLVYDTTYGCHNALAAAARACGAAYADGLSMLVWQGVRSLEIWTQRTVNPAVMAAAAHAALKQRNSQS